MSKELFQSTEDWPMDESYKRGLDQRIKSWVERTLPALDDLPDGERVPREAFLEFLATSVERDDKATANIVKSLDGYARAYVEGDGYYIKGGQIDSPYGYMLTQNQFEDLFLFTQSLAKY